VPSLQEFSLQADTHPSVRFGAQTNAWKIDPNNFDSLLGVLGQVRQIGYTGFETGFVNVRRQFANGAARRQLQATGLTFFGMHVFLPRKLCDPATNLPPASLYRTLAPGGVALGARHLIFSGAPCSTQAQLQGKIDGLNTAGKFCRDAGLSLSYHNETAEESSSKLGELEALYAHTDPRDVSFLLDCGHAFQGGMNVPDFARRYHSRIVGLHLRDYRDGSQVVLGHGTFPLRSLAAALRSVPWQGWVLNEEERLDGSKRGAIYMQPAFQAMQEAFTA
jgi:sugar phosphate isomerase/epimerase